LRQLGHEVVGFDNPGRLIMFGANNMVDEVGSMPADAIMINTEQMTAFDNPTELISAYMQYRDRVVWDYSTKNIEILRGLGLQRLVHCPIGYVPVMSRISPAPVEDIDVLFYGACSERRKRVMEQLEDAGVKIAICTGIFGRDLDPFIARAKVVLNMHFYERPIFEVVRCSHLWANKKCVVTEGGGLDEDLESLASRAAAYVRYDQLVNQCRYLVESDAARDFYMERGFEEFSKVDFTESVRMALEES
jgi:hypothetical protein